MMLLFLAAATGALVAPPASREWTLQEESPESRFFVDPAHWTRDGDSLTIWLRTEPKAAGQRYVDIVTLEEIRCSALQSRTLQGTFHLTGGETRSGRADMPFAEAQPGTAWHAIATEMCGATASGKFASAR
jgi:hypothetical protein